MDMAGEGRNALAEDVSHPSKHPVHLIAEFLMIMKMWVNKD